MAKVLTDLQKLARDVYKNRNFKFNDVDGNEALRKAIIDAVGGEWSYYNYMDNKGKFFSILAEVISVPLGEGLDAFGNLVSVNNIGLTDKRVIKIKDPALFKVYKVARGNNQIARQKIYNKQIPVTTEPFAVKIYTEWDEFISGQVDFAGMIDKVNKSIAADTALAIAGVLASSFNESSNPLYNVSGSFDEAKLRTLVARVKAKTGMSVAIYGTATALGKVTSAVISEAQKEEFNNFGYYGKFNGTPLVELPQAYKNGTETFALDDTLLYVLPAGLELIDLTYQGEPVISEVTDNAARQDQEIEFQIVLNRGITVLLTKFFGIYDVTG